jgi:DNA invertase Pin-like site-specific DNA recombinase
MMKIAIYTRVSKSDGSQDVDNQLQPLRSFADSLQGKISEEYIDYASGGSSDRPNFIRMLNDADKHKFDLLLIWSLDRFSREGISNTLSYLERLKRSNIAIKSHQESWLDTRDEGLGQLLLAIFSWVAQQERRRISERVKAGLERIRKDGKILGRPKGSRDKRKRSNTGYLLRYREVLKKRRRGGR